MDRAANEMKIVEETIVHFSQFKIVEDRQKNQNQVCRGSLNRIEIEILVCVA